MADYLLDYASDATSRACLLDSTTKESAGSCLNALGMDGNTIRGADGLRLWKPTLSSSPVLVLRLTLWPLMVSAATGVKDVIHVK